MLVSAVVSSVQLVILSTGRYNILTTQLGICQHEATVMEYAGPHMQGRSAGDRLHQPALQDQAAETSTMTEDHVIHMSSTHHDCVITRTQ